MKSYFYSKNLDILTVSTKSKPQESLEFKMNKQIQIFSFNPPINLSEEGKWFLGVTSFECTNSVFIMTNENNSFSISMPGRWRIPNYLEDNIIVELKTLLKLNLKHISIYK